MKKPVCNNCGEKYPVNKIRTIGPKKEMWCEECLRQEMVPEWKSLSAETRAAIEALEIEPYDWHEVVLSIEEDESFEYEGKRYSVLSWRDAKFLAEDNAREFVEECVLPRVPEDIQDFYDVERHARFLTEMDFYTQLSSGEVHEVTIETPDGDDLYDVYFVFEI